jgi:hypothetical protein
VRISTTPLIYSQTGNKKKIQKSPNWNFSSNLFEDDSNNEKINLLGLCLHTKKIHWLTFFHIHSFVVFHTNLQNNTIVTCILTSQNHIMSNMQDQLLQLMQLIQYRHVLLFSTIITYHFIVDQFYLSPNSQDSDAIVGFDVTQSTQDEDQSLFTIKSIMPIPMLVYGDSF